MGRSMLNNASNLFDFFSGLKDKETCLATLFELLLILENPIFHRLHEFIKVTATVSDDNFRCLYYLHSGLVWLLKRGRGHQEDSAIV